MKVRICPPDKRSASVHVLYEGAPRSLPAAAEQREQSVNNSHPNTSKQQVPLRAKPTKNQQDRESALAC